MCFLLKQKEVFRQRERERERERERGERERFTDLYRHSHECKHANKAIVSTSNTVLVIQRFVETKDLNYKRGRKNEKM